MQALAASQLNNRALLTTIEQIAAARNLDKANNSDLLGYVRSQLTTLGPDVPKPPKKRWKAIGLVFAALCAIGVGVGHAAGHELWKATWPKIRLMMFGA